ncbi:MAG TPA: ornithine cyclodeaminase family protein, partial [Candidatus Polarisedimenticolia bacterium]|nr:ornithine cyclodeaminase family protein [Candidatus Polarisedimenticolia bacterium]
MPLWLTEDDVGRLLTMDACIEAVEASFRHWAEGRAANRPRSRAAIEGAMLHTLPAASQPLGRMAAKVYATSQRGARFVVLLFDAVSSELLAVIEADRLGQMRTGAASGVATRKLARPNAAVLGVLGSGWQAQTQVQAIAAVRPLEEVRVFARDRGRLIDFCGAVAKIGVAVRAAASAEAAVRGADIVVTATSSPTPVLSGAWIAQGAHVNAVGSNRSDRRELDGDAVARASLIVCDSIDQAGREAGDLLLAERAPGMPGPIERAVELAAVVAGKHPGRPDAHAVTLFKSLGLGLEDLAAASLVFD